ncbi:MAG: glycoside hydrolase family 20 zincin-like fold domain-containing protein, partial [Bacteroidales bacterium]
MKALISLVVLCLLGNLNLKAQEVNIIPAPQEVKMGEGTFTINNQTKIAYTTESKSTAEVLQSNLNAIWGYQVGLAESADGNIKFELNKNLG